MSGQWNLGDAPSLAGTWRLGSDLQVNQLLYGIWGRMSEDRGSTIKGYTASDMIAEKFLDNRDISNEILLTIAGVPAADIQSGNRQVALETFPNHASDPLHQFAVDGLYLLTSIPQETISKNFPDLGYTGTPSIEAIFYRSENSEVQFGTVLHDITDGLRAAGVSGLNTIFFGFEGSETSAFAMYIDAVFSSDDVNLYRTITSLGNLSGHFGAKLAAQFTNSEVGSLLAGAAGKTAASWIGDLVASEFDATVDDVEIGALLARFPSNLAAATSTLITSAVAEYLSESLEVDNPYYQIGVDVFSQAATKYVFDQAAIGLVGEIDAVKYFNVEALTEFNPVLGEEVIIGANPTSFLDTFTDGLFNGVGSYLGSELFEEFIDANIFSESLANEWAGYGSTLGSFLGSYLLPIPGIGSLLGSFLGSALGGFINDLIYDPIAANTVFLNSEISEFTTAFSFKDDKGNIEFAQTLGAAASQSLNFFIRSTEGQIVTASNGLFGHDEEKAFYQLNLPADTLLTLPLTAASAIAGQRFKSKQSQDVLQAGVKDILRTAYIHYGDPYIMELFSNLRQDGYDPTLEQFAKDVSIAQAYSTYQDDPELYNRMIQNIDNTDAQQLLEDDLAQTIQRAEQLRLTNGYTLIGGEQDDVLKGTFGDDVIVGDQGKDNIKGGDGDDKIFGSFFTTESLNLSANSNPSLQNLDGDELNAGNGNDSVFGSEFRDRISGESGNDTLHGNGGNDLINGGPGSDTLSGGQGHDEFIYTNANEFGDTVTDFEVTHDQIDLSTPLGEVIWGNNVRVQQAGNQTLVLANAGSGFQKVATLLEVNADNLDSSNFKNSVLVAGGFSRLDFIWRNHVTGDNAIWNFDGFQLERSRYHSTIPDPDWQILATADFNQDGNEDLLLRHQVAGQNIIRYLGPDRATPVSDAHLLNVPDLNWDLVGTADFNQDSNTDILLRHQLAGVNLVWEIDGSNIIQATPLTPIEDTNWKIAAVDDFNQDGKADLLLRHQLAGINLIRQMDGYTVLGDITLTDVPDSNWLISGAHDFNRDGSSDVIWRHQVTGDVLAWQMNGTQHVQDHHLGQVDMTWKLTI